MLKFYLIFLNIIVKIYFLYALRFIISFLYITYTISLFLCRLLGVGSCVELIQTSVIIAILIDWLIHLLLYLCHHWQFASCEKTTSKIFICQKQLQITASLIRAYVKAML